MRRELNKDANTSLENVFFRDPIRMEITLEINRQDKEFGEWEKARRNGFLHWEELNFVKSKNIIFPLSSRPHCSHQLTWPTSLRRESLLEQKSQFQERELNSCFTSFGIYALIQFN